MRLNALCSVTHVKQQVHRGNDELNKKVCRPRLTRNKLRGFTCVLSVTVTRIYTIELIGYEQHIPA